MNQTDYIENLTSIINQGIELPYNRLITDDFRKLKSFHKQLLWEKSVEFCSIYYESIFSQFHYNPDLTKVVSNLLKNHDVSLQFFEHVFNKYPHFIIIQEQEKIIDYSIEFFPLLFSRTLLSPQKTTHCLFNLFEEAEKNVAKIEFIMENQKNQFIPFHEDMYYFILFSAYMKSNSEKKRLYFCAEEKVFKYRPFKITEEFLFTSKLIYQNFDHIFDFIKPQMIKRAYNSQSFSNTITNENDFSYFIDFVASLLQKEKIEAKFTQSNKKQKVSKI